MTISEKEKRWKKKKEILIREQALKTEKAQFKRKISTAKLGLWFIVGNCTIIEIYSMIVMAYLKDLSALYTLITAVVGESMAYFVYARKAEAENTKDGITYELAMRDRDAQEQSQPDPER